MTSEANIRRRQLGALLVLALVARLGFLLFSGAPPAAFHSNDGAWYLQNGMALLRASEPGPLNTGPVYLLFVGVFASVFPLAWAVIAIKLVQFVLSTATAAFVYKLGYTFWGHRAGMIAGAGVALGPMFIIDSAAIVTEPLFMFLLFAALVLIVEGRRMAAAGVLLGLATLTRAVLLAFPATLVIYLVIERGWRRAVRPAVMLLLVFGLTILPWTVYNLVKWQRFVIAGEGFVSFLFLGAQEQGWTGPAGVDEMLGVGAENPDSRDYAGHAARAIGADIFGWAMLRVRNLAGAVLQPHNTVYYPGASLKEAAVRWLAEDRTPGGLLALTREESFWSKLVLYLFHFTALVGGLAGMLLARRRWRDVFILYILAGYYLVVHFVLYALPRYLFPIEPVWWLFAGAAFARAASWIEER